MKLWLIVKSNMKKKKSNILILFALIVMATVLLYTSICVICNVDSFMDEINESQHGAHVVCTVSRKYGKDVERIAKETKWYKESELADTLYSMITVDIFNNRVKETKEMMPFQFSAYNENQKDEINNYKIIDKGTKWDDNSIIVPMYMKVAKGYKTGDSIKLKFDSRTYSFKIYGFMEDVIFALPTNIAIYRCTVSPKSFARLAKDSSIMKTSTLNIRLKGLDNEDDFMSSIKNTIKKELTQQDYKQLYIVGYSEMKTTTGIYINILMAVLLIFAILIIVIAMLVIRFSISMSIENNLPNIGITEAIGYTSRQMQVASILEYVSISIVAFVAGIFLSMICAQFMAGIVSGSIGLLWNMSFDVSSFAMTVGIIFVMILLMAMFSSLKYRKISPLEALRGGIATHSFRKKYLPLSQRGMSLNSKLGLKEVLQNKKQNISIAVIVALMTFTCIMMLGIYYNFVVDDNALVQLVGMERPNILISNFELTSTKSTESMEELRADLIKNNKIKEILPTATEVVEVSKGKNRHEIFANFYQDCSKLKVNTCIEGRYPKNDNEIFLTNIVMKDIGAEIGSTVTLDCLNRKKSFVVVGKGQQISNLGNCGTLTLDALYRMKPDYIVSSMNIYLKKGFKTADVIKELSKKYNNKKYIQITNFDKTYDTILKSFTLSISMLCVVFVVLTVAVIVLITFLVVRMKIAKERRSIGVYKALGYTTRQIVWQNVMSFAPVISFGGLVGVIIGKLFVNKAFVIMFSICGIENAALVIAPALLCVILAGIVALAFLSSVICSVGVRKIEPYKMITE